MIMKTHPNTTHKQIASLRRALPAIGAAAALLALPSPALAKKGGGKPGGGGGGADTTPPAQITDLVAFNDVNSGHFITLQWTTVGDDGNTGTATSYDLRYSTSPIATQNDWDTATPVPVYYGPREAGFVRSVTIRGLSPNQTYYTGIRVIDDAGNASPISNIASASTGAADWTVETLAASDIHGPDIAFDPLDGEMTVTYADRARAAFIYAHNAPFGWQESMIEAFDYGTASSIEYELSSARLPTVGLGAIHRSLYYSIWNPNTESWAIEVISEDTGSSGEFGYAIDPTDNQPSAAHVITVGKGKNATAAIVLSHRTNQGWVTETVDTNISSDSSRVNTMGDGLAYSADGTAWLAYEDQLASGNRVIKVASRPAGSSIWGIQSVTPGGTPPSLKIDPVLGNPSYTYWEGVPGDMQWALIFAELVNNVWVTEAVFETADPSGNISFAFDSQGQPHITFSTTYETYLRDRQIATRSESGEWHVELYDRALGAETALAVDPISGEPAMVHAEETSLSRVQELTLVRSAQ